MAASLDITYFLSIDTWAQYGFTDTNTDVKKLRTIIRHVQRNRIKPVMGTVLYDKLVSDVKADTLTGLYKELMDDHILRVMICYCDWKATFHTTYQIGNKTTGKNNDEHVTSNTVDENETLRKELAKDASSFMREMKGWLCDKWDEIPELSEANDADTLFETIKPHTEIDDDYAGTISII